MKPWYREPWPWLVMAGPIAVFAAGAATIWVAFASADGLVAEDYYKQGLAINRQLARQDEAARRGISAEVAIGRETITVRLQGASPEALFVHLAHATRAGHDVRLRLERAGDAYATSLPPLPAGRWRIAIDDPRGAWRIVQDGS